MKNSYDSNHWIVISENDMDSPQDMAPGHGDIDTIRQQQALDVSAFETKVNDIYVFDETEQYAEDFDDGLFYETDRLNVDGKQAMSIEEVMSYVADFEEYEDSVDEYSTYQPSWDLYEFPYGCAGKYIWKLL